MALAQESVRDRLGDTIDCTDVRVHYVDDPFLTQEERLRLMDKAFLESLNKFDLCRSAKEMAAASDTAIGKAEGATQDSGDAPSSTEETESRPASDSVASSTMSGTEAPDTLPSDKGDEVGAQGSGAASHGQNEAGSQTGGHKTSGNWKQSNGKIPEDIPSAQNDDALAAQIRYAAENETDPAKQEQLWNEYRKYKGLPTP
jgi:hypothetical protein